MFNLNIGNFGHGGWKHVLSLMRTAQKHNPAPLSSQSQHLALCMYERQPLRSMYRKLHEQKERNKNATLFLSRVCRELSHRASQSTNCGYSIGWVPSRLGE
jgi:hypothetical protein